MKHLSTNLCSKTKVNDLHARLKAVVDEAVAANPNRTIITNITFDRPVECDAARIQELASHLLRNALAHGAPGGPVSFVASAHDDDLEIAVWNDGGVLSKQSMQSLLKQAWIPASDRASPSLGLHECANIVQAHLGTIDVTSSPTDGTQFIARIPVTRSRRLH